MANEAWPRGTQGEDAAVSAALEVRPALVRQKLVPPGLPTALIARPRLDALYGRLLEDHGAVAVFAAAGSGKTVQAQLFARQSGLHLAWLTLDPGDRSPSRMLSYLAATVHPFVRDAEKVIETAFGESPVPEEAAAVLADRIDVPGLLIVLDQCENIADSTRSCAVLETFLDYLPDGVRTLLLSRTEMRLPLGRLLVHGRMGRVTDADLALTSAEAGALVAARGDDPADAERRWEAARGWVAAVAFGAQVRSGGYDAVRDFNSYLDVEVLDGLPPEERQFLLDTSILDAVSLRAATAVCGPGAKALWQAVSARHLPATTTADRTIVYHPCFRDFLQAQLELDDPARLQALQRRRATLLIGSGQYEDAVELLLSLDLLDEAADAAVDGCGTLIARADWDTFLRWADVLGRPRVEARPALLGALLRSLRWARRLHEARALARGLEASGLLAGVVAADPGVIVHVAWSLLFQPAEALGLLDRHGADPRAAGVRFTLETTVGVEPVAPPPGLPWGETDRILCWGLMVQGRIDDLLAMLPPEDEWPPRRPFSTPIPLFGLVWRGELERARDLFDQVSEDVKGHIHTDTWYYLEAWLLLAEGDAEAAVAAARRAVAHSRRTGFGYESVFALVEGLALLGVGRVDEGTEVLEDALAWSRRAGLPAYTEWAEAFLGRARLLEGDDAGALELLRRSVAGMERAGRLLLLPIAAIYLAEAERRAGDEIATLAAAERAGAATFTMGAHRVLSLALEQFPALRSDLQSRHPGEHWRPVPPRRASGPAVPRRGAGAVTVTIQPFGPEPDIVVDGRPASVRRLKVLELACLLSATDAGVRRQDVQERLFPESDRQRGGNHFRQVVHQLRRSTGLTLRRPSDAAVEWPPELRVEALDRRFERVVAARGGSRAERLAELRDALALVTGPYLPASDLQWVSDRRFELEVRHEEAALEAARLALEMREFDAARELAEGVLARNPYSEAAYRTLIQYERAVGSDSAALAAYRRALAALREIGLEPAPVTAGLLRGTGRVLRSHRTR